MGTSQVAITVALDFGVAALQNRSCHVTCVMCEQVGMQTLTTYVRRNDMSTRWTINSPGPWRVMHMSTLLLPWQTAIGSGKHAKCLGSCTVHNLAAACLSPSRSCIQFAAHRVMDTAVYAKLATSHACGEPGLSDNLLASRVLLDGSTCLIR